MAIKRRPFQGLINVLRFNWHFYLLALLGVSTLLFSTIYLEGDWQWVAISLSTAVALTTLISLFATYCIYDLSELYDLKWLDKLPIKDHPKILNINAGFDETSLIIADKFKKSDLHICDFYDPKHHTEVSIKRARKAYPPPPKTVKVKTTSLPYSDNEFDIVCLIFAAHEIRDFEEREQFFRELKRVTKQGGKVFVTEHLRDSYNFFAYTIGFFHFYSRTTWMKIFNSSKLNLLQERKTTAFVSTFILTPHGTTS